ncbi:MAG: element excision factor XisI family protein [Leptolyngbya sp. IPPAS B-1204]
MGGSLRIARAIANRCRCPPERQHKRWVHHCVMHLDIRNEKVWIFYNSTEHDIAADLVNLGVPKQDIVLGFHPPFVREMSDYAVG